VFPNVIDYWGPCGMVFFRNPQVRWTPLQTDTQEIAIALERPINDIDPGNIRLVEEFADGEIQDDEKVPDFTIHYRVEGALGHLQVAGMLRRVGYDYRANSSEPWQNGAQTGWGVDLSGAIKTGEKDKLMLSIVHGRGIASYMNDGGMDLAPTALYFPTAASPMPVLSAEAVPLTGVLAYYDLYWNNMFSTALGYSVTEVQNTNFQEDVAFHKGQYASLNLLATPNERVLIGAELMWGRRTNNNGDTGNDVRFQFSAKYSFDREL
jgi:Fe-S-cluster formation regulator IscX/YfhJ